MTVKDKMYKEIQLWKESGKNKATFIMGKNYSKAKFEYWIDKYNKEKDKPSKSNFKKVPIKESVPTEVKPEKVMQIEAPSGIKITVYR